MLQLDNIDLRVTLMLGTVHAPAVRSFNVILSGPINIFIKRIRLRLEFRMKYYESAYFLNVLDFYTTMFSS